MEVNYQPTAKWFPVIASYKEKKAEVNLPPRPWNILKLACVTALWVKSIKSEFN